MVSSARTLAVVETIGAPPPVAPRLPLLSALRGGAAQLIVLHHLAFYGPLSDIAYPVAPGIIDWLFNYGRFAVQVFFVIGGFLTARSLAHYRVLDLKALWSVVVRRYQRVGFPYLVTLIIAVGADALADHWMEHESISPPPTVGSVLAHTFFLQDIFGYRPITAGIWYLAIDFQLILLTFLVAVLSQESAKTAARPGRRALTVMQAVFGALALASIFWLNRDKSLDMWALYFFASYPRHGAALDARRRAPRARSSGPMPRSSAWRWPSIGGRRSHLGNWRVERVRARVGLRTHERVGAPARQSADRPPR